MTPTERHYPWHVALAIGGGVYGILTVVSGSGWLLAAAASCIVLAGLWFVVDVGRERRGTGSGSPPATVAVVPSTASLRYR